MQGSSFDVSVTISYFALHCVKPVIKRGINDGGVICIRHNLRLQNYISSTMRNVKLLIYIEFTLNSGHFVLIEL